jgi:hypothetical protein
MVLARVADVPMQSNPASFLFAEAAWLEHATFNK